MLDSTIPNGKTLNINNGRPKSTSAGVLKSCLVGGGISMNNWYALRATYSRELKVQTLLNSMGIRTFVPMMWRKRTVDGHEEKRLVPAVSGLIFVHWDRESLDSFIRSFGEARPVNYYWDRTAARPLTVPDKAMEDFISIASTMDEDIIYLTEVSDKLREGQTVKVKDGPFKGVEGKIVRIRKSRRILVELPGMLAVASTYVSPNEIELI